MYVEEKQDKRKDEVLKEGKLSSVPRLVSSPISYDATELWEGIRTNGKSAGHDYYTTVKYAETGMTRSVLLEYLKNIHENNIQEGVGAWLLYSTKNMVNK